MIIIKIRYLIHYLEKLAYLLCSERIVHVIVELSESAVLARSND